MRRIAVINQKGGVGKTTTTANLGAALARAGKNVFLIDLDPQGHLSLHFGSEVSSEQVSIYDVLTADTPMADAVVELRENISIVPADIDLAGAEAELVSVMGREVLLREAIEAYGGDHDVLLVDCPPSLGVLTINALASCEEVLIPLQAHFFGLQGLGKLLETVTLVRQRINPMLKVTGIVLCMHESTTRLASEVADDIGGFLEKARGGNTPWASARLFQTTIRRNIKLAESSSFGQTVFDYAPKSNGAIDYANLAVEIFGDIEKPSLNEACTPKIEAKAPNYDPQAASTRSVSLDNGRPATPAFAPAKESTPRPKSKGRHAIKGTNGRFIKRQALIVPVASNNAPTPVVEASQVVTKTPRTPRVVSAPGP